MSLPAISDLDSLRRCLKERFGAMPGSGEGVLHVAAVWRPPGEDRNVVLRIGDDTPKSAVDFLLLNVARARADAIVTTGRILREERGVTHDLQGAPGTPSALAEWRRAELGLSHPPWLLVLTAGRDLDPGHPALHSWARPIVLCPEGGADEARRRLRSAAVDVVGHPEPGLRAAVDYLRDARAARRISIEAGPSTAIEAYREPLLVDELLLSVFTAETIRAPLRGGELPTVDEIQRLLGPPRRSFTVEEESGRWRFERYAALS
jgi:riboflavin biosynthesis pyrimidine reductase